mgnify:CR=1 FL=1
MMRVRLPVRAHARGKIRQPYAEAVREALRERRAPPVPSNRAERRMLEKLKA